MRFKNNPFNIRWSKYNNWKGQEIFHSNGFCEFKSLDFGVRAFFVLMYRYRKLGFNSVEKIVSRYAPVYENPTRNYINFVADRCFLDCSQILCIEDYFKLAVAMWTFEQGVAPTHDEEDVIFSGYLCFRSKILSID